MIYISQFNDEIKDFYKYYPDLYLIDYLNIKLTLAERTLIRFVYRALRTLK